MSDFYYCKEDEELDGLLVVFGSFEEIQNGELTGDIDSYEAFESLQEELADTGAMCEDYLIESEIYTRKIQIAEVERIVESYGFIKEAKLGVCGWG